MKINRRALIWCSRKGKVRKESEKKFTFPSGKKKALSKRRGDRSAPVAGDLRGRNKEFIEGAVWGQWQLGRLHSSSTMKKENVVIASLVGARCKDEEDRGKGGVWEHENDRSRGENEWGGDFSSIIRKVLRTPF